MLEQRFNLIGFCPECYNLTRKKEGDKSARHLNQPENEIVRPARQTIPADIKLKNKKQIYDPDQKIEQTKVPNENLVFKYNEKGNTFTSSQLRE